MKICMIGNSHCAALNDAWKTMAADHPEIELTIFAAPRGISREVEVSGNSLVPRNDKVRGYFRISSGGAEEIDLKGFDRVLVYGLFRQPPVDQDDSVFSKAALAASRRARVQRSHAQELVSRIRGIAALPIDVAPNPFRLPAEGAVPATSDELIAAEHRTFAKIWQKMHDARYIPQPEETVLSGRATKPEFGKGALRLSTDPGTASFHDDDDNDRHVNADYGRIWMSHYLDGLRSTGGGTPARRVLKRILG